MERNEDRDFEELIDLGQALERMCIEMIAQRNLDHLTRALTPAWASSTTAGPGQ